MYFITWDPKTALQGQPEQKRALLHFSWVLLRPEPPHGWTCPCQAVQGTGSSKEGSQGGAYLCNTLLLSPVREVLPFCFPTLTKGDKELLLVCPFSSQHSQPKLQNTQSASDYLDNWIFQTD